MHPTTPNAEVFLVLSCAPLLIQLQLVPMLKGKKSIKLRLPRRICVSWWVCSLLAIAKHSSGISHFFGNRLGVDNVFNRWLSFENYQLRQFRMIGTKVILVYIKTIKKNCFFDFLDGAYCVCGSTRVTRLPILHIQSRELFDKWNLWLRARRRRT